MSNSSIGAIFLAIILFVGVCCCVICLEKIPAGYVGVVYNMNGGVDGEILTQGWHVVSPTKKVTTYSIGIEQSYLSSEDKGDSKNDESFKCPTSDGKSVTVELEFSYRFDESRVANTFVQFKGKNGESIKDTFIKPKVSAWTQEITALYPVTDIFGDKRTDINAHLDTYLREKFDPYGIIIDTVNFTNIEVDPETAAAIQKKVNAQQELELANIEAQTAKIQAEKDKEVAEIAAERKIIEANAAAESVRIAAQAEADANREISASLTDSLIQYTYAQNWDGELPKITGGGSTIVDASDYFGSQN
jgi:regulator of protease activity HflC (stomatin/prohibitin superfamily)